ncbi:cell division protein FtsX [Compostibacillus humi]|uniref:Cell division protein FtsX n=1 Tax=Compostibacillus humi TaxID=1245525 RepID=A0A8J2ZSD3_9BACI|nr:permease-like cell division protein FtsX [Compostibacillus humi]GGH75477.1 cell division protein FtsX [Compostibacillus humi]HLT55611.1 permease-like cell division protein FtsX [Bacillota bacterium]
MKFNTLLRHLRAGFRNIIRNGWMTVASIGAVTTTLILVAAFLALMLNLNEMAKNIEDDVQINTLIELTATDEDVKTLGDEINAIDGIEKVTFSSKDDELKKLIDSMGDEGEAWQLMEQDNPLNHVFIVEAENPQDTEQIAKQIETLNHVEKVVYGQGVIDQLFKFNNYARVIGLILIFALVFTAIFLISNTIKITIIARSEEIGIMKLVGATNWFIRWPFLIEGLLLGVFGSILPVAVILAGYNYLESSIMNSISFSFVEILPFHPFAWQLSALVLSIGALIGVWGSVMSIRKFLKV